MSRIAATSEILVPGFLANLLFASSPQYPPNIRVPGPGSLMPLPLFPPRPPYNICTLLLSIRIHPLDSASLSSAHHVSNLHHTFVLYPPPVKMKSFFLWCSAILSASAAALTQTPERAASNLPFGSQPIPFNQLATSFHPVDVLPADAIRNTLALYPFAVDGKNFAAFSNVFAQNAVANYSAPLNVLTPLSDIISVIGSSLECVTTQHSYGTQLIDVLSPFSAFSVTYFRAMHFGKGATEGQALEAYGQYQDTWALQTDFSWKIINRNLVYMVSSRM